jgi:hypothetical protein
MLNLRNFEDFGKAIARRTVWRWSIFGADSPMKMEKLLLPFIDPLDLPGELFQFALQLEQADTHSRILMINVNGLVVSSLDLFR